MHSQSQGRRDSPYGSANVLRPQAGLSVNQHSYQPQRVARTPQAGRQQPDVRLRQGSSLAQMTRTSSTVATRFPSPFGKNMSRPPTLSPQLLGVHGSPTSADQSHTSPRLNPAAAAIAAAATIPPRTGQSAPSPAQLSTERPLRHGNVPTPQQSFTSSHPYPSDPPTLAPSGSSRVLHHAVALSSPSTSEALPPQSVAAPPVADSHPRPIQRESLQHPPAPPSPSLSRSWQMAKHRSSQVLSSPRASSPRRATSPQRAALPQRTEDYDDVAIRLFSGVGDTADETVTSLSSKAVEDVQQHAPPLYRKVERVGARPRPSNAGRSSDRGRDSAVDAAGTAIPTPLSPRPVDSPTTHWGSGSKAGPTPPQSLPRSPDASFRHRPLPSPPLAVPQAPTIPPHPAFSTLPHTPPNHSLRTSDRSRLPAGPSRSPNPTLAGPTTPSRRTQPVGVPAGPAPLPSQHRNNSPLPPTQDVVLHASPPPREMGAALAAQRDTYEAFPSSPLMDAPSPSWPPHAPDTGVPRGSRFAAVTAAAARLLHNTQPSPSTSSESPGSTAYASRNRARPRRRRSPSSSDESFTLDTVRRNAPRSDAEWLARVPPSGGRPPGLASRKPVRKGGKPVVGYFDVKTPAPDTNQLPAAEGSTLLQPVVGSRPTQFGVTGSAPAAPATPGMVVLTASGPAIINPGADPLQVVSRTHSRSRPTPALALHQKDPAEVCRLSQALVAAAEGAAAASPSACASRIAQKLRVGLEKVGEDGKDTARNESSVSVALSAAVTAAAARREAALARRNVGGKENAYSTAGLPTFTERGHLPDSLCGPLMNPSGALPLSIPPHPVPPIGQPYSHDPWRSRSPSSSHSSSSSSPTHLRRSRGRSTKRPGSSHQRHRRRRRHRRRHSSWRPSSRGRRHHSRSSYVSPSESSSPTPNRNEAVPPLPPPVLYRTHASVDTADLRVSDTDGNMHRRAAPDEMRAGVSTSNLSAGGRPFLAVTEAFRRGGVCAPLYSVRGQPLTSHAEMLISQLSWDRRHHPRAQGTPSC